MKKLAVIGCGLIGSYHLDHFIDYTDVELVGFCDIIIERAEEFVKKAGKGNAYSDFKTMFDKEKPDMIFICVPPTEHGAIEMEAIERGIHFFVEKPLSLNLDEAEKICNAAEAKGLITASGFQCRYSNIVKPTIEFLKNNPVPFLDCGRMGGIPEAPWWIKKDLSGGQIVEQTIHQFDIIRYMFSEPVEVFTMSTRGFVKDVEGYDTDDLTSTVIKFANGALGTISTGCYAEGPACYDNKITFSSANGRLDHYIIGKINIYGEKPDDKEQENSIVVKGDGAMRGGDTIEATTIKDDGTAGVVCDRTFVDAVISGDGSKILSSYRDALRSVSFTLACNESIDTGKPVKVRQF